MSNKFAFVNADLSEVQRVRYADLGVGDEEWHFLAESLVEAGLSVSFGHNIDNGGYRCAITDKLSKSRNEQRCLTAWGGSLASAFDKAVIVIRLAHERDITWENAIAELKRESSTDVEHYAEFLEWKRTRTNEKGSKSDEKE